MSFSTKKNRKISRMSNMQFFKSNFFLVKKMTKVVDIFLNNSLFLWNLMTKVDIFLNNSLFLWNLITKLMHFLIVNLSFFSRGKVWKNHVFHIGEGLEYMHFHDLRPFNETIRIDLNWRIDIMPHYANQISSPLIVRGLTHSKIGSSSM